MIGKYKITGMKAEGYNIVGAMLNNNVVYSSSGGEVTDYYIDYTIVPRNDTDTIDETAFPYVPDGPNNDDYYREPGYYLPKFFQEYHSYYTYASILLTLKDGTTTSNTKTLAKDVSKIRIYFYPNTTCILFGSLLSDNQKNLYNRVSSIIGISDTSKLSNMSYMFYCCRNLTSVNVSDWDTSKVTSMGGMFYDCPLITSLDVSNWDVRKVDTMANMFKGCTSLSYLPVQNWVTSSLTTIFNVFENCSSLTNLNLEKWDMSNVSTNGGLDSLFAGCTSLKTINGLSNWNTSNVTYISGIFYGCKSLTSLDISNWDTSNVTDMWGVFYGCESLTSLDLSKWNTSNVTNALQMFSDVPTTVNWNYNGSNYTNWTLTESQTGYDGTFPWNK